MKANAMLRNLGLRLVREFASKKIFDKFSKTS